MGGSTTSSGAGYCLVDSTGRIFSYGDAAPFGSASDLNQPTVDLKAVGS